MRRKGIALFLAMSMLFMAGCDTTGSTTSTTAVGSTVAGETTIAQVQSTVAGETTTASLETTVAGETTAVQSTVVGETTDVAEAQTVDKTTQFGPVKGIKAQNVCTWYGVPYGKEPVGALRWQAPQDPEVWTEALDCTKKAEQAMQLSSGEIVGTQNCLNLDIYATEQASNLPVFVFIHGGNNQTGQTTEIPGSELVIKDNCVYISLNYRLGLLGFNCLPALQTEASSTGNYAMQDIAKALDWIKANIAQFGGDANNITVSGFSAGGRDVMAMLISPIFAGKFQKAVAFSGGMTTADETLSASKIAKAIAPLAVADGKAADETSAVAWLLTPGADVKEYLYSISAERLCALMGNAGIRMSVFPHLYEDDIVIPSGGFATTNYNDVPVLMLTGSSEFSMFCLGDSYFSSDEMAAYSESEITAAKEFAKKYGSDMYRIFNAQCSAETMANAGYQSNIYICQVNYGDDNSAMKADLQNYGAFHGIFVPMLSTKNNYTDTFGTAFEKAGYVSMASQFNQYLTNFMNTGNPNGGTLKQWDNWTKENKVSMLLDGTETEALLEVKDVTSSYEAIIEQMKADTTISEEIKNKVIGNVMNGRWFSSVLDNAYQNKNLWE